MNSPVRLFITTLVGVVLALGTCTLSQAAEDGPKLGFPGKGSYEDYKRSISIREKASILSPVDPQRIILLQESIKVYPYAPGAFSDLGNALEDNGKTKEAENAYKTALKMKPDEYWFWFNYGLFLKNHERIDEAISCYNEAIRLAPSRAEAPFAAGNLFLKNQQPLKAIKMLEIAIKADPYHYDSWNALGRAYVDCDRLNDAENAYKQALSLKPSYFKSLYNLCILYKKEKKWDNALVFAKKALESASNSSERNGISQIRSEIEKEQLQYTAPTTPK